MTKLLELNLTPPEGLFTREQATWLYENFLQLQQFAGYVPETNANPASRRYPGVLQSLTLTPTAVSGSVIDFNFEHTVSREAFMVFSIENLLMTLADYTSGTLHPLVDVFLKTDQNNLYGNGIPIQRLQATISNNSGNAPESVLIPLIGFVPVITEVPGAHRTASNPLFGRNIFDVVSGIGVHVKYATAGNVLQLFTSSTNFAVNAPFFDAGISGIRLVGRSKVATPNPLTSATARAWVLENT